MNRKVPARLASLAAIVVGGVLASHSFHAKAVEAQDYSRWVPKGWRVDRAVTGDLDGDGAQDVALVLQQNDRHKRVRNEGMGAPQLDLNPRRLLVLLRSPDGLRKAAENSRFLPPENDAELPCLADPLEEGGVRIERGLLFIDLHQWVSCGSWSVSHSSFTFRLENGRFRLIGLDGYEFMRNTGERSETSTNFLTGKKKVTTGINEFDDSAKPRVSWERLPAMRPIYLDRMSGACDADDQPQKWCQ